MRFKIVLLLQMSFFAVILWTTPAVPSSVSPVGTTSSTLTDVRTDPTTRMPLAKAAERRSPDAAHHQNTEEVFSSGISDLKTEVVGFALEGKKPWETLNIEDLDLVVTPSGQRLVPLLRLLKALQMEMEERTDHIVFQPSKRFKIILDLQTRALHINDQKKPIFFVVGTSDITFKKDVYMAPEAVSEILLMQMAWDEQNYRFTAKTDNKLKIWDVPRGVSLLAIQTQEVPQHLPELFPPAQTADFSLDFIEFQLRPYYTTATTAGQNTSHKLTIDSPRQTFWGNGFGGRYRLQFSEPWVSWDNTGFKAGSSSAIMMNRGDWTYSFSEAELTVGDSVFGLNDLTFPIVRMTGVRFNGMAGFPEEKQAWRASPGAGNYIIPPRTFEGEAPIGSKAELIVNDRSIETQDVLTGTYRFEDIRLAPGSLNVIRIVITEANGFQRIIEQSVLGRSIHLPRGGFTYLGGFGTNRQVNDWSTRGLLGGGRVLYGVNDSLTVGTTWAAQGNFYIPRTGIIEAGDRQYPQSSIHIGGQAAWIPWEYAELTGDMSLSNGSGEEGFAYSGMAFKIKGDIYPTRDALISSQIFYYGPEFFNGENTKLRDREGYALNGRWAIHPKWWVALAMGGVRNNLDHRPEEMLYVDFQNLEISSKMIPRMTITCGANRISPNWEDGAKTLYTVKVQANPFKNIYFDGSIAQGNYLDPAKQPDFFSGLRIPGFSTYQPPAKTANLIATVTKTNSLGAAYWEDPNRKRGTVIHNFTPQEKPIRIHTEFGYDINYQKPFFENRSDYFLNRSGQKLIGIQTRYEYGDWTASLLFTFTELFSHHKGSLHRVSESNASPDRGGVHGRVFIDDDATGIIDPSKPGIENIRVVIDHDHAILTNRNGYFILPASGRTKQSRVFLDVNTIPAIYSPTHAVQTAQLGPAGLTEVNFGITPVISISGHVQYLKPDKTMQPLAGIRVYLTRTTDDVKIADSITAGDGSYYLGDVRPGKYCLRVDTGSLPSKYVLSDQKQIIEILPKKEPQDLKLPPFLATLSSGDT